VQGGSLKDLTVRRNKTLGPRDRNRIGQGNEGTQKKSNLDGRHEKLGE